MPLNVYVDVLNYGDYRKSKSILLKDIYYLSDIFENFTDKLILKDKVAINFSHSSYDDDENWSPIPSSDNIMINNLNQLVSEPLIDNKGHIIRLKNSDTITIFKESHTHYSYHPMHGWDFLVQMVVLY